MKHLNYLMFCGLLGVVVSCGPGDSDDSDDQATGGSGTGTGGSNTGGSDSGVGGEGTGSTPSGGANNEGSGASGSGASNSGGTTSGGTSSGGAPGSGGSGHTAPQFSGFTVDMFTQALWMRSNANLAARWVREQSGASYQASCEVRESGPCRAYHCSPSDFEAETGPVPHAGTLSATMNTDDGPISVQVEPDADGVYEPGSFTPAHSLLGLETGEVSATGADVAPFQQAVEFPLLLLSEDPVDDEGLISVSKSGTGELHWARGDSDVFLVIQYSEQGDGEAFGLQCWFDSLPGEGTIDPHLMEFLPTGTELTTFTAKVYGVPAGDDLVHLRMVAPFTNMAKDVAVGLLIVD